MPRLLLVSLFLFFLTITPLVGEELAQSTESAEAADDSASESDDRIFPGEVETITVTARRREETVQEIPGAISVISEDTLEVRQILNTRDVQREVPNVVIERNTGTSSGAKIFLRGIGTDESLFTAEPAVGIYVDDVYIPRQTGASFDLFDLERVEVLRGPQGTLYGRNTNGGAIKMYTVRPTADRRGRFHATLGDESEVNASLSLSGALGDGVFGKFSALSKQRDGFSLDLVNNRDVNDQDVQAARFAVRFNQRDDLDVQVSADYVSESSTAGFASSIIFDTDDDLYTLESGLDDENDLDQGGLSVKVNLLKDEYSFTSITAYREMDNLLFLDADGTPLTRFHLFQDQEQSQISQELQFGSISGGDLQWDAGVFYFEEENTQPTRQDIFATGGTNIIAQDTTSYAAYGQITYRKNRTSFTGGLRYSYEEKDFRVDAFSAGGSLNFVNVDNNDWDTVDWRAEVSHQFKDNVLGYFTAATGFKSGGFNGRGGSPAAQGSFDEEEVTNFEIGIKSDLHQNKVRLNVNYYFSQYDGLQLSTLDEFGVFRTINAADTEIQGIELDLEVIPVSGLAWTLSLGTIDGEYTGAVPGFSQENELKQAPDLTYSTTLQYTALIGDRGYLTLGADLSYTDEHFQNVANSPLIATDDYSILNARVAYGPAAGNWEVALLGTNITDEQYFTGGFDIGVLGIGVAYLNKPSWYGASFSYRF